MKESIKITKKMKANIESHKAYFESRIKDGYMVSRPNAFVACGVFNEAQDHITKGVNTIWVYQIGFNFKGTRIVELQNVEMTLEEAEDLRKCLDVSIKRFKGDVNGK